MELESYFDFVSPDDIRLKGTRLGIETVLYDYIHRGLAPEEIAARYPSLTLEHVYATLTYYLRHREAMDTYLQDWLEYGHRMRQEQDRNPPPVIVKLRGKVIKEEAESAAAE